MSVIPVSDLADPRLDAYARLTDVQLRSRLEPECGVFIAESGKVIERAFAAGAVPLSVLLEEKWLPGMASLLDRMERAHPGLPVFTASRDVLSGIAGFEVTRGALAAFRRPPLPSVQELLEGARLVAVLESVTNHTNIGAIFRSAAALGVDAVLVDPTCYDPLYRRAVRVSMGTVFQVPWTRIGEAPVAGGEGAGGKSTAGEGAAGAAPGKGRAAGVAAHAKGGRGAWAAGGIDELHRAGFFCAAMALADDAIPLDDPSLRRKDRIALLLGTEGDGLSREAVGRCDVTVRIPMANGVDSLNVAAASAVAFWELRRR